MERSDVINILISLFQYKRYLEIGVWLPEQNFDLINCQHKDGVDPAGRCNYPMTSDEFFNRLHPLAKYDLIFIDGLHEEQQVDKDFENSLKHLSKNGTIVMHDVNPTDKNSEGTHINGTVWRSWAKLRMNRRDLYMYVVDCDYGCGVVYPGVQELFHKEESFDYSLLDKNRKQLLNLTSPEEFFHRERTRLSEIEN